MPFVLVIGHDQTTVELLYAALAREGYRVESALAVQAVVVARRLQPELILLLVSPLQPDTVQVSRQLQAEPATTAIPIVGMTSAMNRDQIPGLITDDLLQMPVHLTTLYSTVARWVQAA